MFIKEASECAFFPERDGFLRHLFEKHKRLLQSLMLFDDSTFSTKTLRALAARLRDAFGIRSIVGPDLLFKIAFAKDESVGIEVFKSG